MVRKSSIALLAALMVALFIPQAQAQNFWGQGTKSWGVGLQFSVPTGNLSDVAGIGFGGFGKFQYGLNDDAMLTGSIGYTYWTNKSQYGVSTHASAVPLLVGAKYNLGKYVTPGFYGLGEVGFYFESWTAAVTYINPFTLQAETATGTSSETEFALCLGVGYQFQNFDVSAKYAIAGDASNIAIGVAYQLPLQ